MKDKGSITIISLMILTLVFIISIYSLETSNLRASYNSNFKDSVQADYLLFSYRDILLNDPHKRKLLDDFIKNECYLKEGKLKGEINKEISFNKYLLDEKKTNYRIIYNIDERNFKMNISQDYKGITTSMQSLIEPINDLFLLESAYFAREESNDKNLLNSYSKLKEAIYESGFMDYRSEEIIITDQDILIEDNLKFSGIIIQLGGKLIVKEGSNFSIDGLYIARNFHEGNLYITRNDEIIRRNAIDIPGFLDYKIISNKIGKGAN